MHLRKALWCAAMTALVVISSTEARAVNPARLPSDRGSVVPQPYDPLLPASNPGGPRNPGTFDPFAPTNGTYPPPNGQLGPENGTYPPRNGQFGPSNGLGSAQPSDGHARPTDAQGNLPLNPQVAPNPISTTPRWRLGVYSVDSTTGVEVIRVTPNSPADLAGLEKGDVIVTVAGYQVGMIENTRRELAQVFNAFAGNDGHVMLLVQDNRNRSLTNLDVHLETRQQRIEGTVTYRDEVRLPRNAEVRIDLYETIRPGVSYPIVSKTITNWRNQPIPFRLEYDPSLIDPRREYNVHATVVANNRTYYRTRNPYPVISDGYPRVVDLRLFSTDSSYGGGFANNRDEQLEQIVAWFREYLNREIRPGERQVYTSSVDRGESLDNIRAQLLGLPEFYNNRGHDDESYIRSLYEVVLNRQPRQQEVSAWLRRLDSQNGIRTNLAREFLAAASKPN